MLKAPDVGFEVVNSDVLVIGKGIAGSIAALTAAEQGLRVVVVSQSDSATHYAQGGIVYKGKGDPGALRDDILQAGCYVNFRPAVEKVVDRGPELVDRWLRQRFEVPFDSGPDGETLHLALEAAHSTRRILHVRDHTGETLTERMNHALFAESQIEELSGSLIDLIVSNKHSVDPQRVYEPIQVCGAYVLLSDSRVIAVTAQATVLATGGFSGLYQYATGPKTATGSGIAAAHRAGARTLHLEYTQFHPTVLLVKGEPSVLITEAIRGEGAMILRENGERFADPLAPRDVLARAMHDALSDSEEVQFFLDVRPVRGLAEKFPALLMSLKRLGVDDAPGLLPIVPAAHYSIGGVWTDVQASTSLRGLWACGEVACTGLHGANRLASTSLLEGLVFGEEAGQQAARFAKSSDRPLLKPKAWIEGTEPVDAKLLSQDWSALRKTMWNYVGLVRSQKRMDRAERILGDLRSDVESFYKNGKLTHELIALRHAVLTATLCLHAAQHNRKSLGSHYLKDS